MVYQSSIALATTFLEVKTAPPEVKIEFIFSDQVEFRHRALMLYEQIYKTGIFIKRSAYKPVFRDMREIVQLQSADIAAYEMYKEYDRVEYRPDHSPRWGLSQLEEMSEMHGHPLAFRFFSKANLIEFAQDDERRARKAAYWEKKKAQP